MPESQAVTNAIVKMGSAVSNEKSGSDYAYVGIDLVHHEVHEGNHYTAVRSTIVVNAAAFANLMFVADTHAAGSRKNRHFTLDFSCDKSGTLYLLENTGTTGHAAGGTTYAPLNNYRASTKVSNYKYYVDATTKNAGTTIWRGYFSGAQTAGVKIGGSGNNRNEFILDPTKDYLARFDPENATTTCIFVAQWYEESTA